MNKSVYKRVLLWGVAGAIFSLGALFSKHHLLFDLLSHFRVQYIVLIALVLLLSLSLKEVKLSAVLVVCLALQSIDVYRSLSPAQTQQRFPTAALSVMSSNLDAANTDYTGQMQFYNSINADVIVFLEYTLAWHAALNTGLADYPYKAMELVDGPFGIAVYSKYPLLDAEVVYWANQTFPSIVTKIQVADKTLDLFATHPPPPLSTELYQNRNRHLTEISALARQSTNPVILVGDLNTSPWSAHFRQLSSVGGLVDSRRGLGIFATWPSGVLPLQIPIDHILVSKAVKVMSLQSSSGLSSDHRTLWANLKF